MCFAAKQGDASPVKHSLACLAGLQMHCKVGQTTSRLSGTRLYANRAQQPASTETTTAGAVKLLQVRVGQ